jgi:hypothetical protein
MYVQDPHPHSAPAPSVGTRTSRSKSWAGAGGHSTHVYDKIRRGYRLVFGSSARLKIFAKRPVRSISRTTRPFRLFYVCYSMLFKYIPTFGHPPCLASAHSFPAALPLPLAFYPQSSVISSVCIVSCLRCRMHTTEQYKERQHITITTDITHNKKNMYRKNRRIESEHLSLSIAASRHLSLEYVLYGVVPYLESRIESMYLYAVCHLYIHRLNWPALFVSLEEMQENSY